jgi:hypothetical protein
VTEIDLLTNSLTGPIPSSWQGMAELKTLSLYSNKLSGQLPTSLGMLEGLQVLYVSGNVLTGPLPPQWSGMVSLATPALQSTRTCSHRNSRPP